MSASESTQPASLLGVPLEVRHAIFEFVAVRDDTPEEILRYWFEKKDMEETIDQLRENPDSRNKIYTMRYSDGVEVQSWGLCSEMGSDEIEDFQVEFEDTIEPYFESDDDELDLDVYHDDYEIDAASDFFPPAKLGLPVEKLPVEKPASVVKPSDRWRHVSNFVCLTHCPLGSELFLVSRQLNAEAKNWFYKVAAIKIDATANLSDSNFFELTLKKLGAAADSPMVNINKAEVTFVWDSSWIKADTSETAPRILPELLYTRAKFIVRILQKASKLEYLIIHWHDSAQDDEATNLMAEVLGLFVLNLNAIVKTENHYAAPNYNPPPDSRLHWQRSEFEEILHRRF